MFCKLSLVVLLVAMGLVTNVYADDPKIKLPLAPPISTTPTQPTVPDPGHLRDPYSIPSNFGPRQNNPGGYPTPSADSSTSDDLLLPQNPVRKAYEDGKIIVVVGSERHFGYHIGDIIPVTIVVLSDDSVQLNFEAIQRGILGGAEGSDFELTEPAKLAILQRKSGKTLRRIDLKLRSFVPEREIGFTALFFYATELGPDGKTPLWKQLVTPQFVVSTSNTADNGTDLLEGNQDEHAGKVSWFTYPLLVSGLTLVLLWPSLFFWQWYRRVHPPKVVPANELAWRIFDRVRKESKIAGFTVRHYKQIAASLRKYFGIETATMEEVAYLLKEHPDVSIIISILKKCEMVIYVGKPLDEAQNKELFAELEQIVPRP